MASRLQAALAAVKTVVSPRHHAAHLHTTTVGFAIWWVVLFLLHGVNAAYYLAAAKLYRVTRENNVGFQLATYSIGISLSEYNKVATVHTLVAIAHLLFVTAMIVGSLQARRLAFLPNIGVWIKPLLVKVRSPRAKKLQDAAKEQRGSLRASFKRRVSSFTEQSVALTNSVFGREGLLGVDSVYFDHILLVRELIETTLQTIQVYRMSYLLPRVWLIRFYVLLLIANCWSTPFVHHYYRDRHVKRRMMSLLCDLVLDMVSSIGVSLWIFATYAPQYTDPAFGFPFDKWFDDVWFANMQQEFQMMMVVSWADVASKLVFAVGLLQCMDAIKEMLEPNALSTESAVVSEKVSAAIVKPSDAKKLCADSEYNAVEPSGVHVQAPHAKAKPHASRWSRFVHFILETAGPALFIAIGVAILVVHIVSEAHRTSASVPCQLTLHPWFVNKPSCSLVELDCHQLGGISGSQESMEKAWNAFDFGASARLMVRHCPQLEMPPTIRKYKQVTAIKLYNCTVSSWSTEAAFTAAAHANMRALFAIRTEFPNGELPPGLVTTQFPQGLKAIVTSATNIGLLPDNLDDVWPQGMTLAFENSQLQVIPPALTKLHPLLLSVAGSPIAIVPREVFENPLLECVLLSYTNVQELPRHVTNPAPRTEASNPNPGLYLLLLEGTNVSTFWSWMEPFIQYSSSLNSGFFNAYGSRYCTERDEIVAGNRTGFSITTAEPNAHDLASVMDVSTPEALAFAVYAVTCETGFPFFFPLELQDIWSAINA